APALRSRAVTFRTAARASPSWSVLPARARILATIVTSSALNGPPLRRLAALVDSVGGEHLLRDQSVSAHRCTVPAEGYRRAGGVGRLARPPRRRRCRSWPHPHTLGDGPPDVRGELEEFVAAFAALKRINVELDQRRPHGRHDVADCRRAKAANRGPSVAMPDLAYYGLAEEIAEIELVSVAQAACKLKAEKEAGWMLRNSYRTSNY